MLAYSAMKKKANRMPLYSVKNPATSSLSASGRSNGHAVGFGHGGNHVDDKGKDLRGGKREHDTNARSRRPGLR